MDSDQKNIIEGEITNGSKVASQKTTTSGAVDDLITITNLIQSYIGNLDRAQEELKAHKQMLTDAFSNDPIYREHEEKVKEVVKVRNGTKQQILKQPQLQQLSEKVKEMSSSIKEMKEALSNYLQDYARMTGSREFEDAEGELREIVYVARLVKTAREQKH